MMDILTVRVTAGQKDKQEHPNSISHGGINQAFAVILSDQGL